MIICIFRFKSISIYIYIYLYLSLYLYLYLCIFIYIYIYVYMYVYIYLYIGGPVKAGCYKLFFFDDRQRKTWVMIPICLGPWVPLFFF